MHIIIETNFNGKGRPILGIDRFAKDPLLYIQQVKGSKINANMQHRYVSSKQKKQEEMKVEPKEKQHDDRPIKKVRTESVYKSSTEIVDEENEEINEQKERRDKPFQKMTIEEKLHYLVNRPEYAPRLTCEVKTEKRAYRGIILNYQDEIATIRSGKRKIEIPGTTIKQIRMLGL